MATASRLAGGRSKYMTIKEILDFVFSSFWYWLGTVIILWIPFDGTAKVIRAIRGSGDCEEGEPK